MKGFTVRLFPTLFTVFIFLFSLTAEASPYMNPGFMKQPQAVAGPNLAFTNTAFSGISTWSCSMLTVTTRNAANVATNVGSNTTINLTGPTGVHFYSDAACKVEITSVVVTTGSSSKNVYFMAGKQNATTTLTAANAGYTSGNQNQSITSYKGCTWLGTTTTWNTATNWSCGHVPTTTAGDIAVFDSNCTNCSPDAPTVTQTPYGLWLTKDYTGTAAVTSTGFSTFTVQSGGGCNIDGGTLTIGSQAFTCSGAFYQTGGVVIGADGDINLDNNVTITGGTFTTPSTGTLVANNSGFNWILSGGTLTQMGIINLQNNFFTLSGGTFIGGSVPVSMKTLTLNSGSFTATSSTLSIGGNLTVSGSPTFNHNNGTVIFDVNTVTAAIIPGTINFYNVIFNSSKANYDLTGTMTVSHDFLVQEITGPGFGDYAINGGVINVSGNLSADLFGLSGTTAVTAVGRPAGQTITSLITNSAHGAPFPHLVINTGANPVTLSAVVSVRGDYEVASVGTFNNATTALSIYGSGITHFYPGPYNYKDVILTGVFPVYELGGQTLTVTGDLVLESLDGYSFSNGINSGSIVAYGNVIQTVGGYYLNSATLTLAGNASGQTLSGNGGSIPSLIVATGTNAVTIQGSTMISGNYTYTNSGTFTTAGSTLSFQNSFGTCTITAGNVIYNNINMQGIDMNYDLAASTMNVDGNFDFGDASYAAKTIDNGTVLVKGNVTAHDYGTYGSFLIKLVGNPIGQTISGTSTSDISNLEIAAGGNQVSIVGTLSLITSYKVTSVGTFDASGSTMLMKGLPNGTLNIWTLSENYNNVSFTGDEANYNLNGSTMNVTGSLAMSDASSSGYKIDNGILKASASVSSMAFGKSGSVQLQFVGTNQTYARSALASVTNGDILVNITGTLTLTNNMLWSAAGQDLTITSGAINMANKNLTTGQTLTMSAGTSITRGTGTLKVNGVTIGAGPYSGGTIF